jgi:hypothetical protein
MAGSVYTHIRDAIIQEHAGSVYTHTRDVELINRAGSVFSHTRGAPVIDGLIRGPQFRYRTIGDDRFVNRLTSVISTTSAIDLTTTSVTNLYTVPVNKLLLIQGVVLRATNGSASTDATVSVGINPSTTNIFDLQELVLFRNANDLWSLWNDKSTTLAAQASEQIDLTVDIAATGTLDTDAYLIGFLI